MKKMLVNYWGLLFFYLVLVLGIVFYNPRGMKVNGSFAQVTTSVLY